MQLRLRSHPSPARPTVPRRGCGFFWGGVEGPTQPQCSLSDDSGDGQPATPFPPFRPPRKCVRLGHVRDPKDTPRRECGGSPRRACGGDRGERGAGCSRLDRRGEGWGGGISMKRGEGGGGWWLPHHFKTQPCNVCRPPKLILSPDIRIWSSHPAIPDKI